MPNTVFTLSPRGICFAETEDDYRSAHPWASFRLVFPQGDRVCLLPINADGETRYIYCDDPQAVYTQIVREMLGVEPC